MNQEELENLIIEKNNQYREGFPTISDLEYDSLVNELRIKFPSSYLLKKSILEEAPISRKEKLPIFMSSLEQVSNIEELRQWIIKYKLEEEMLLITPKLDGSSICTFEGIMQRCWTRGDGEYGQNCDKHFARFTTSSAIKNRYYYGEAMISKNNFSKVKELHPEYKNRRNGVAGLLKRDEVSEALHFVDYIRYGVKDINLSDNYTKLKQIQLCNELNEIKIPYYCYLGRDILLTTFNDCIEKIYQDWKKDYLFEIDGLVIDISDNELRQQLGRETNGNPIYAKKIKFGWEEVKETIILKRKWQVSKDGKLKPVAEIEPVELAGATISNVTLYNAKYCFDKGIGKGIKIKIRRSGEVIPEIIEVINPILNKLSIVLESEEELINQNIITNAEEIEWDETDTNYQLKEKNDEWLIQEMVFFFDIMKLENFGEPSIRKLFNSGYRSIKHILELTKQQIIEIEGFGEITADYLLDYFKKWKEEGVDLYKYAAALNCFKGLGEKLLKQIPRDYFFIGTWCWNDLEKIEGFKAKRINAFIDGYKIWKFLYCNLPIKIKEEVKISNINVDGKCKNWRVVFTQFRDQNLEDKIREEGGIIMNDVTKQTTHLIIKEKGRNTSKEIRANNLRVEIFTKERLIKELE